MDRVWKVPIIELEEGHERATNEILFFRERKNALKFVNDFNAQNNVSDAPPLYWAALPPSVVERNSFMEVLP